MRSSVIMAASVVTWAVLLSSSALPAYADIDSWSDREPGEGTVVILERSSVSICDTADNRIRVAVEYQTSFGRTLRVTAGPRPGCVEDSVWLGHITTATFCYGYDVDPAHGSLRWCRDEHRFSG